MGSKSNNEPISYLESSGSLARRDAGELEFYYLRISAVKTMQAIYGAANQKMYIYFLFPTPDQPLAKEPEESGYEIETTHD